MELLIASRSPKIERHSVDDITTIFYESNHRIHIMDDEAFLASGMHKTVKIRKIL